MLHQYNNIIVLTMQNEISLIPYIIYSSSFLFYSTLLLRNYQYYLKIILFINIVVEDFLFLFCIMVRGIEVFDKMN